jgi:hypothetical protein
MMGNYEYTPLFRSWDAISLKGDKSWHAVLRAKCPDFGRSTQGQRDKLAMRHGLNFMLSHPLLTLKRSTIKFFDFWQLDRSIVAGASRGFWGVQSKAATLLLAASVMGSYAVATVAAVFGVVLRPPRDVRFHVFVLLLLCFVCAIHTVVFAHSRYLLPMMPLVLIYSAGALADLPGLWKSRGTRRFAVALAVSFVLVSSWLVQIWTIDLHHVRELLSTTG